MAVPAALMLMVWGMVSKACTTTSVSSQTDRLSGIMLPPERACMINALLLMLFEAGNLMEADSWLGADILILIVYLLIYMLY